MKKVIIINGIDVSECDYYEDGMCSAERDCDGHTNFECKFHCPNCNFKQLQKIKGICLQIRDDDHMRNIADEILKLIEDAGKV